MRFSILAALGLTLALAWPRGAPADTPLPPQVGAAVPGHPGFTYLDLLRQVIPNLAYNRATKQVEGHLESLRHVAGEEETKDPPDPVVVDFVENLHIKAGGKQRLVLLVDLGQGDDSTASTTLLALYDDGARPKLLDAVDVGVDKQTSLNDDPSKVALGPGDDAIVTFSGHGNSNQAYTQRLIILVRGDRFRLLDDISLLSDTYCGWRRDETPTFATRPGAPYATLVVTVTERLKHIGEGCSGQKVPAPYAHTYRTTYRWNAAKGAFVGEGDMAKLDNLNEKRF